jgi:hypothetical protein
MSEQTRGGTGPALGLFVLSPFVAEFLLGTIGIDQVVVGLVLAPLYGGGVLLVREAARRTGGGWPAILLLAFAYGVIEEGVVVQSLFNPRYLGLDLLREGYVPWLGTGAWWSVFVLTLHTVWSMAVPIALAEALARARSREAWLGRVGFAVAATLFLLGAALTAAITYAQHRFMASPGQLGGAVLVALGAVAAAWRVRPRARLEAGRVPRELTVGLLSFAAASAFMGAWRVAGGWALVAVQVALLVLAAAGIRSWSARTGWTNRHVLALAGGALMTYAWYAFVQAPLVGGRGALDPVGDALCALVAAGLLAVAVRRVSQRA